MAQSSSFASDVVNTALGASGQVVFELSRSPEGDAVSWSDQRAAERLFCAADCPTEAFSTLSAQDQHARANAIAAAEQENSSYCVEYQIRTPSSVRWLEERGTVIPGPNGPRVVGVIQSISDRKTRELQLEDLASRDEQTGQLNRAFFKDRVAQSLDRVSQTGAPSNLLLIGVDAVGQINSDFGFQSADQVIVEVADRIVTTLNGRGICGRVAGTKFGVLLENTSLEAMIEISRDIMSRMRSKVVETDAGSVGVSVCIGAASISPSADSASVAMAEAEAAFDQARRKGPSSFSIFSETTETVSRRQRNSQMTDVILGALNDRRIYLAFQPIVADVNAPHTKYECLVRMRDDNGGEVPAPSFVPAAERLGLVHLLDRRVLELATQTLSQVPGISLNVNLSWETVKDPVWAEGYLGHLRASRRVCDRLTIELTETQVVDAIDASIEFVSAIKSLGCRFAIDDFGAGYTSFRNLKALDIDVLKIDGSFVSGVSGSRENQLFVRTLLDLARNFGVETVAEWVDNDPDATLLKALGVDYLQGFYIGKPEAHEEWNLSSAVQKRA